MKYGIPTCTEPTDAKAMYLHCAYHTFFWGPFKDEQEVIDAINILDEKEPYWDYEPFCIVYGMNPLPKDFAFGFPLVDTSVQKRIDEGRKLKVSV